MTSPLRTVLDCARHLPLRDAVVVADSALRRGLITRDQLVAVASRCRGTGAGRVRRVAEYSDPRCESVLESVLRVLLIINGLAPVATQLVVRDADGRFIARVDFWFDGLVVEADGFEFHSSRGAVRTDRRRGNAFTRMNLRVLRFCWEDVFFDERYVTEAVRDVLAKVPLGTCGRCAGMEVHTVPLRTA